MNAEIVIVVAYGGVLVLGGLAAVLWKGLVLDRRRDQEIASFWERAARALGLPLVRDGVIDGRFEGFNVRVERRGGGDGLGFTRLVLSGEGSIPEALELRREPAFSGVRKAFNGEDVLVGEGEFDRLVHVQGPEDAALAALGAGVRGRVKDWVGFGGSLKGGDLTIDLMDDETSPKRIQDAVRDIVALAKDLAVGSVPAALQANAAQDPQVAVRLRNLGTLVQFHGETPRAREALRSALRDRDPLMRLFAAQRFEGAEARTALVNLVAEAVLPEQTRALALERLAQAHPWEQVKPVVAKALYAKGASVRRAAVHAVGKAKDAALLADLVSMIPTQDGELGEVLAKALGHLGGERCEAALLELLATVGALPARRAVLEALAWMGTVCSVEPLVPLSERGPLVEEARSAVRAIQARLGDAAGGRLSVVDAGAGTGGLSLESGLRAGGERAKEKGMIPLFLLLFLLVMAAFVVLARVLAVRSEFEVWQEAARDLKISTVGGGLQGKLRMVGDLDRHTLDVERNAAADLPVTRFRLESHGQIPLKLVLRPAGLRELAGVPPSESEVSTGDPLFDQHVHVAGPADVVFAVLDAQARRVVLDFAVRLKGELRGGDLEVEVARPTGVAELVAISRAMLAVAEELQATSVPEALCVNAEHDPLPQVRRNALEALARYHKKRADHVERLAQRATNDPDPAVFLSAIENLMDDGQAREALARVVEDRKAEESLRVRAFDQFLKRFPYKDAGEVVTAALRGRPSALTRRAVDVVAANRDLLHLDALLPVAFAEDPELARAVAETLGKLRDPRAEPCLLELLQREEVGVKRAAVAALARVGTTKSVEPLLPLTRGFLADPKVKDEAQEAIRWIQGRVAGGDSGGLSVAEVRSPEGGLSLPGAGDEASPPKKPEKG